MDSTGKGELYPPTTAYKTGEIVVGDGHVLYFELSGNPKGLPVVILHGGPGAGCTPTQRRYFDPKRYRVILFDQRGSGRSTPFASTTANTTAHLVSDMEKLRLHLGVERWLLAGGSWGSTLALVYGINYPQHCLGFLLRGMFLGTKSETDWFVQGMGKIFPEAYGEFSAHVGGVRGDALVAAYHKLLFDKDPARHLPAARAWARYENRCSTLHPQDLSMSGGAFDTYALSVARIEAHYLKNHCFLRPDEIMERLHVLHALPAVLVQGRYDIVCPIETAFRVNLQWPNCELVVVPDAGHSGMEPGIAQALRNGADKFLDSLVKEY